MRLSIEITYHSSAFAVSLERFPLLMRGEKREKRKRMKTTEGGVGISWWSCTHACIDVRGRIEFYLCAFVETWTLISRFREIIRGGCVISFLVISCSTRRRILRIFHSVHTCIRMYMCNCVHICESAFLF